MNDQRMMVRGLEQTNRVSIEYAMIIERSGMEWNECVDPMMELPIGIRIRIIKIIRTTLDLDMISENGRNIYE